MVGTRCTASREKIRACGSASLPNDDVMEKNTGFMKALKCRECGREYPLTATHVCEFDFGPLEVVYDYRSEERRVGKECRL